ncbi:MAG: TetR/AcrR family transcriptional regulator [Alphaproteobacteria bacterium]|nr:TetR/AcrR family transcriptional regulator [Alphaproteobacteria bacterium]MBU1516607.1 TetR/AcrR family transcriptional regulator [Alphaproteobacteria bacterium]MBU2094363.1 TetR/AcrR family transcriptional regulator [Alphaproteobacteria bacterium]MBU2153248.1 TetR/AcrR family transcriptional regulator [Alphaproteobacteria bacterium]MBU2307534.1 TetR/AcrR family transcriptional regulator [Alphaproteobacteria bacterium]
MTDEASRAPRGEDRRRAVLETAAALFFERGYAATSIDAIIARAGGSKRNIYAQFGSKAGLFTAIVSQNADQALATLEIDEAAGRDLRETLAAFGRRLLEVYMSPTVLGIYRVVVAEAHRDRALAEAFYDKGPGRTSAALREVLERAAARGEIAMLDPAIHAEHFVGLTRDNLHLQVVLGLRPPPAPAEIDAIVRSAVALFLDGLRPR